MHTNMQEQAAKPLPQQRLALGALAAASVATMALVPMEAQAVFGEALGANQSCAVDMRRWA